MPLKRGEGSLVVLRSWIDSPPKVIGIARDNDKAVTLEPDLKGEWREEEIKDPDKDPQFKPRGRTFVTSYSASPVPSLLRHRKGDVENKHKGSLNRYSYGSFYESSEYLNGSFASPTGFRSPMLARSMSNLHIAYGEPVVNQRPNSVGGNSIGDQQDASSIEYTPPPSPSQGRYRNLGPELAATIPKRTIKSNWVSGIKARWMKHSTTHPESDHTILKSYNSSPSLANSPSCDGLPFYNPLYEFNEQEQNDHPFHTRETTQTGSSGSSSGIVVSADEDDRSRTSLSNHTNYTPSPPPTRMHRVYPNSRTSSSTEICDDDQLKILSCGIINTNSTINSSPFSELGYREQVCSSIPSSQQVDTSDECVLVEVIRKPETLNTNENSTGNNNKRTKNVKRHSVGELEPEIDSKFAGVKVEGSPGKVARLKESIKRFGRFGRNHSEKILRFREGDNQNQQAEKKAEEETEKEGQSNQVGHSTRSDPTPSINKEPKSLLLHESEDQQTIPVPTTRIRSKDSDVTPESSNSFNINSPGSSTTHQIPQPQPPPEETDEEIQSGKVKSKDISSNKHQSESSYVQTKTTSDVDECVVDAIIDAGEEEDDALVPEQDRSLSSHSHVQSLPPVVVVANDDEPFTVHSANPETLQDGSRVSENFYVDVKYGDFRVHQELHVVSDELKQDEMFRVQRARDSSNNANMHGENENFVLKHMNTQNNAQTIGYGNNTRKRSQSQVDGTASAEVPVHAVNRFVKGYGNNGAKDEIYANDSYDYDQPLSPSSVSSDSRTSDFNINRSATRESFRGFCEGLLHNDKLTIKVPEIVEASMSFENEEFESSVEDTDEERENSVDYISIADVKVNRKGKKSNKSNVRNGNERDALPGCVISLDLGSRGTGYCYWVRGEDDFANTGRMNMGYGKSHHKVPSWISFNDLYTDEDNEEGNADDASTPSFGYHAMNRFLSEETQSHLFYKWKETFNDCSTFPYTLESKMNEEELQMTLKSVIKHYTKIALDQVTSRRKGSTILGQTILSISVPSSFDHRARKTVRDAAFGGGLISKKDQLVLMDDSYAAGIYAYHAVKQKIAKLKNLGTSFVSLDIGGVYLHSVGCSIEGEKLYRKINPKSQLLPDAPESLFEAELSGVFTPSFLLNYQTKYKAGWLKLLTEFDHCMQLFEPLHRGTYYVFLPASFVDHFRRFTSMEVEDALESSDFLWNKVGALGIPYWKMERLLQPMTDFIKNHAISLIRNQNYEFLVISGGRSGTKYLFDRLKSAFRDFSVDVILPDDYGTAVLQGNAMALTNLEPRVIIKSPFSIGVGVMTPFADDNHPEEKRVIRDDKPWCADVWDPLINVDQELEVNTIVLRRSYVGAQPGQSVLILPVFQSSQDPKFVTEASVKKCCEFKFNAGQRAWQEIELVIKCRPSELLVMAVDNGITKDIVVLDFNV